MVRIRRVVQLIRRCLGRDDGLSESSALVNGFVDIEGGETDSMAESLRVLCSCSGDSITLDVFLSRLGLRLFVVPMSMPMAVNSCVAEVDMSGSGAVGVADAGESVACGSVDETDVRWS